MAKRILKQNRYNRNSTKQRLTIRPIKHPLRLCAIVLGCVAVVVTAIVWGNILYQKSEDYRADKEAGRWTVETVPDADTLPSVKDVPPVQAWPVSPDGSLRAFDSSTYSAATLWLCHKDRTLPYRSQVAQAAGLTCGEYSLSDDVERLHENGLRAIGVFSVHAFSLSDEGANLPEALVRYQMETELSIIAEYAAAGLDEILLVDLPTADTEVTTSVGYVTALRERVANTSTLIGVNLSPAIMAETLSGSTLPAELLIACDYLTLDMTKPHTYELYAGTVHDTPSDEPAHTSYLSLLLYRYRYLYVRYNLRLLFTDKQPEHLTETIEHGFDRYLVTQTHDAP